MPKQAPVTQAEFVLLAELRHALRQFAAFSEEAAQGAGLTPAQHQALLAIKGFSASAPMSVGDLAQRLIVRHHSAVGLVDRLTTRGFLRRVSDPTDGRRVNLALTRRGETVLEGLSSTHKAELKRIGPQIESLLAALRESSAPRPRRGRAALVRKAR